MEFIKIQLNTKNKKTIDALFKLLHDNIFKI